MLVKQQSITVFCNLGITLAVLLDPIVFIFCKGDVKSQTDDKLKRFPGKT